MSLPRHITTILVAASLALFGATTAKAEDTPPPLAGFNEDTGITSIAPDYVTQAIEASTYTNDPVSYGNVGGLTDDEVRQAQHIAKKTLEDNRPSDTLQPGHMWSDRIGLPPGIDKDTADKAELIYAQQHTTVSGDRIATAARADECITVPFNPHPVCGEILNAYQQLGGVTSWLLWPVSEQTTNPDGVGVRQEFKNGYIYYHPDAGAHAVSVNSFRVWAAHGWEAGWLGYPTSAEDPVKGTSPFEGELNGWVQHFQGGRLYRTPLVQGAHVAAITGEILKRWEAIGGPASVLGFPISDETPAPDGAGRFNVFQFGSLWWHPATGAWEVPQTVDVLYNRAGGPDGHYGYPTGETTVSDYHIPYETPFQNGGLNIWDELGKDEMVTTQDGKVVSKLLLELMGGASATPAHTRTPRDVGDTYTDPATKETLTEVPPGSYSYEDNEVWLSNGKQGPLTPCPWNNLSLPYFTVVPIPENYRYLACHRPRNTYMNNRISYYFNGDKLSLHDFCTFSPDYWTRGRSPARRADLRGPCALHDMCYEKMVKSNSRSFAGRVKCDKQLGNSIQQATAPLGLPESTAATAAYRDVVILFQGFQPSKRWP